MPEIQYPFISSELVTSAWCIKSTKLIICVPVPQASFGQRMLSDRLPLQRPTQI